MNRDEERFNELYRAYRTAGTNYAGRLIRGEGSNTHILGAEAAEIYDEAMDAYYKAGEHLQTHDDHERNIKHRIQQRVVAWLRKTQTAKRKPPFGRVDSLDAPPPERDDGPAPRHEP